MVIGGKTLDETMEPLMTSEGLMTMDSSNDLRRSDDDGLV
jgi:hypothetical protein